MEKLTYNGRELSAEPSGMTLARVARILEDDKPVSVLLEPGDATAYHLLLVPCGYEHVRSTLGWAGVPEGVAEDYLLVISLDPRGGTEIIPWDGRKISLEYVVQLEANDWSRSLLAWWLDTLLELTMADPPDPRVPLQSCQGGDDGCVGDPDLYVGYDLGLDSLPTVAAYWCERHVKLARDLGYTVAKPITPEGDSYGAAYWRHQITTVGDQSHQWVGAIFQTDGELDLDTLFWVTEAEALDPEERADLLRRLEAESGRDDPAGYVSGHGQGADLEFDDEGPDFGPDDIGLVPPTG